MANKTPANNQAFTFSVAQVTILVIICDVHMYIPQIDTNADMTLSTLFISSSDTVASDNAIYPCQEILTVNGTDMFTYSGVSHATLTGKYT